MGEWLNIGDVVEYTNCGGTEHFRGKITAVEVWVPAFERHVQPPKDFAGVRWDRVTCPDKGSEVIVYVQDVENEKRNRWGFGTQIRPV